jgi:regulatory protein
MPRKITALQAQKRNHQRMNVYLDGTFAFGLTRIVGAWLNVGQELTDEKIAELQAQDARESAYQLAVNYLSYRDRTQAELEKHLKDHDIAPEICAEILARLAANGLLNDRRFAQRWAENRSEFRPRSRRMLAFEMRQKGLAGDDIQDALEQVNDEVQAYQAALSHTRKLRTLDWPDFRNKMLGFLARRGFNYETAAPAVARVWAETHTDHETETRTEEEVD